MKMNAKTPEIRFEGFVGEWEIKKLGDVAEIVGGGTPDTNNPSYWDGDIDWYAPAEIQGQIYTNGSVRRITEQGLQNSSAKILPAYRTILFTSRAGIGKMAILQREGATNQGFQSLVLNDDVEPYFIYSMNEFIKQKAEGVASGSTFLEISGNLLRKLTFSFPSLSEQKQIGAFFERLDALIALYRRRRDNLANVKKSLLEKTFPRDGAKVPEIRFEGFVGEWETRRLKELASFSKGSGYTKNDLKEIGTPIILYGRLYTQYETVISIVDTFVDKKNNAVCSRGGEVVVPASGETAEDISVASVVAKSGVLFGGDLNVISPTNELDSIFLAISITNGAPHYQMARMAQGKSIVHLHNSDLEKIDFFFPSLAEQQQIGKFFQELDALITLSSRLLEKIQNVKKSFLSKAFVSS